MATSISNQSGILMPKPKRSTFDTPVTSFETNLAHAFFVGRYHPIDLSPDFYKYLKYEYDKEEEIDVEIDLDSGSNELLEKPGTLSFGVLLDHLIDKRKHMKQDLQELVMGASIVCRRGVLNKLINAPYKDSTDFKFAVKKYRGIFFIKELSTLSYERQNVKFLGNPQIYLPKFKKRIVADYGDENYKPPKEVSTWEQMQGVFVCDLASKADNKHLKILYGTEIDAFDKEDKIVEIKLQKGEIGPTVDTGFMCEKLRKWFFQTQLVGGDTVVVGMRTNAVVTSIKKFKIDTFPSMVTQNRWDCVRSYSAPLCVLSAIVEFYGKNVIAKETLIVELEPYDDNITYQIFDDHIHDILPKEFKDAFEDPVTLVDESAVPETGETKMGYVLSAENGFFDDVIEKTVGVRK